jgi:hypothetical protein
MHNMLLPGKNKPKRIPMGRHPFTLVQVIRYDEAGNLACQRPMWLLAIGQHRHELRVQDIYEAYKQRYDHFSVLVNRKCCWMASRHQMITGRKSGGSWFKTIMDDPTWVYYKQKKTGLKPAFSQNEFWMRGLFISCPLLKI